MTGPREFLSHLTTERPVATDLTGVHPLRHAPEFTDDTLDRTQVGHILADALDDKNHAAVA